MFGYGATPAALHLEDDGCHWTLNIVTVRIFTTGRCEDD